MPHGAPDWFASKPTVFIHTMGDLGEHAARTGSPVVYDRRGNVVSMTTFIEGLGRWYSTGSSVGSNYGLSHRYAVSNGVSMFMTPDDDDGDACQMGQIVTLLSKSLVGIECRFTPVQNLAEFQIKLGIYTMTRHQEYIARFDHQNLKLYVNNPKDTWVEIGEPERLYEGADFFVPFKAVFDTVNAEHVRVLLGDTEYSAAGIDAVDDPGGGSVSTWAYLKAVVHGANAIEVMVDDIIITQNE